ncbi:MAG TPA: UDP-N-acetylmuramoyl-L-alanine--D-glutamate ligase [Dissulfurispiraceae bacterium]
MQGFVREIVKDLRGRAVTVVGLARSGAGAANLLSRLGASVTVTDRKGPQELKPFLDKLLPGVKTVLGGHPSELFDNADLIVISPGVPLSIAPLKQAAGKGVKIIGELELAYQALESPGSGDSVRPSFLAVTGTNGKSTTTTLLYEMVRNGGLRAVLGGNIGYALTEAAFNSSDELSPGFIVAEVSNFQLETIDEFRPKGSVILNITPDHLDRYPSMSGYIEAKCAIFANQGAGDFLVLNADDPVTEEVLKKAGRRWTGRERPELFFFSRKKEVRGAYCRGEAICFDVPGVPPSFSLDPSTFRIKGVHNIENAMAAALMALLSGCRADAVADTMKKFPGLEHRLEFVREIGEVKFINDSKGTNVGAVVKSLESFERPVILIAGGRDKDGDFTGLRAPVRERVKALVLIGEAREKMKKALWDVSDIFMEDDFRGAIARAKALASPGDVVLLSPACASFDMFKDFEDRGRQFKKAVMEL